MASYITSYFGSGNPSQPAQGNTAYPPNQGSTSSTWASTVSSRISTLRKALTKGSEEDDPDNEDCSHVSNVLRAYYTEKGRPFPEWLPPDPKKPVVAPVQQYGGYGNAYAQQQQFGSAASHSRTSSSGRGGLSDLWDSGPAQAPSQTPQSLRGARPQPQNLGSSNSGSRQSGSDSYQAQPPSSLRPGLPSQRSNSYQGSSQGGASQTTSNAPAAPAMGSRDRLRARLQGAGTGRSSSNSPLAYSDSSGGDAQNYSAGNMPQMSASQPWMSDATPYGYEPGYGQQSNNSGNPSYRPRPGPR